MPRRGNSIRNFSLLTAALEGLELQKQRIDEQIQEVRSLLGQIATRRGRPSGSPSTASPNTASRKRPTARLSAAARKRIAAAQKRRWAEYRKSAGATSD
ncbi:MAG: hypothetical protein JOZ32_01490 [Bryobacterales bacterium]|nr:hypothetical protein [Bryobacterales bacterium]